MCGGPSEAGGLTGRGLDKRLVPASAWGCAHGRVGQRPLRQQRWEAVSREGGARCPRTFPVRPRVSLPSEPDADSSERGTNVSLIRRCSRPLPPPEPPAPGRHCGGGSPSLFVPSLRLSPDSSGSPRARPSAVFCRGTERNEGQSQAPGDRERLSVCLTEDAKRGSGPALSGVGVPCGEAPTCPAHSVDPQSTLQPGPGCPPDPAGGRAEPP